MSDRLHPPRPFEARVRYQLILRQQPIQRTGPVTMTEIDVDNAQQALAICGRWVRMRHRHHNDHPVSCVGLLHYNNELLGRVDLPDPTAQTPPPD